MVLEHAGYAMFPVANLVIQAMGSNVWLVSKVEEVLLIMVYVNAMRLLSSIGKAFVS